MSGSDFSPATRPTCSTSGFAPINLPSSSTAPTSGRAVGTVDVSELDQERILQLPDTFVMRRMSDAICREHQVRPRNVAEINAIETLLRSLAPLKAAALMPKIALRGTTGLTAIRLKGKNLALEIGLLRLIGSGASDVVSEFAKLARATLPKMVRG